MLTDINQALARLLFEVGRIDQTAVDVSFTPPTRTWMESLRRPTVNFFLYDVQENIALRQASLNTVRGENSAIRRMPPRRFELRYLVSAIAPDIDDEHRLLWRTLVTLINHPHLPGDVLPEPLRALDSPLSTMLTPGSDELRTWSMWSALQQPPRPSLLYTVTVPVEMESAFDSPLVLTRTMRYTRASSSVNMPETHVEIGGTVRNRQSEPIAGATLTMEGGAGMPVVTDEQGRFRLTVPSGEVTVRVVSRNEAPPMLVSFHIPSDRYDIVLD